MLPGPKAKCNVVSAALRFRVRPSQNISGISASGSTTPELSGSNCLMSICHSLGRAPAAKCFFAARGRVSIAFWTLARIDAPSSAMGGFVVGCVAQGPRRFSDQRKCSRRCANEDCSNSDSRSLCRLSPSSCITEASSGCCSILGLPWMPPRKACEKFVGRSLSEAPPRSRIITWAPFSAPRSAPRALLAFRGAGWASSAAAAVVPVAGLEGCERVAGESGSGGSI
mmetsp:Transcript_42927/g.124808  ORF Transcript_42927/g.124808 Transcript_42927/m.124808 type:complete len:226 (+) Transcript_42927:482-1159(+)